jgi:acetyl-CoA carboxylase biotin carboxyl carrier protein
MNLDIEKLRTLLALLQEQGVHEFEHEAQGVRMKIVRGGVTAHAGPPFVHTTHSTTTAAAQLSAAMSSPPPMSEQASADSIDVTSPFVGTFYRSPTPDAPSFVDVGSVVRPGQTLCIIEAMKLMNEIEAEVSGTVVEVYAQNGKSVEFGQKLFRIKKA